MSATATAWLADSLNPVGRGVLTCGDHADHEQVLAEQGSGADPLHYDPKPWPEPHHAARRPAQYLDGAG